MPRKILVVDDERPIADILKFNLEKEGYSVITAFNGEDAIRLANSEKPELILLDIMLPKIDGFEVCRKIRATSSVPLIIITAKNEESDVVLGLELGADEYIVKPFSPKEVTARIKALLRRADGKLGGSEQTAQKLEFDELVIDLVGYQVWKRGQKVDLTLREFELLKHLAMRPGQVFTRETLLQDVWGYEYFGDVRTVDVTVRRLREKVEDDPSNPRYIQTRRGVGYYFQA